MKKILNKVKKRSGNDPIFDNNFNKGEIDFQPFNKSIEIDKQYSSTRLNDCYNSHDYYRKSLLDEQIDNIYKNSKWCQSFSIKRKIPKCELSELFQFIRDLIMDNTYSESEIFVEIADYLDLKYKTLYDMISNSQKRKLLLELDTEFSTISSLKTLRLF